MRLPKKIRLGSRDYRIKRDRNYGTGYGRGNTKRQEIIIGSGDKNEQDVFSTFIHEIAELAMLEESTRFDRDGQSNDFIYIINHKDLDNITEDIASAVYPMVKNNGR